MVAHLVPYRKEEELRAGKATYAEAFEHWIQTKPALWQGKAKRDTVEASKEFHRKLLQEAAEEEEAEAEAAVQQPSPQRPPGAPAPAPLPSGFRSKPGYATQAGLQSRVDTLNAKQRAVWTEVTDTLAHQQRHADSVCLCSAPPPQVLKFISGGAGFGKSRLIETLTEAVEAQDALAVLAAPSGLAAQNIKGSTIHSTFNLPVQKSKGPWVYEKLDHAAEKELHQKIGKARLIILDEVSMVSNIMLYFLHLRLASLKGKKAGDGSVFGGMNIVVLGDLCQLPPVKAPNCFERLSAKELRTMIPGSVGMAKPIHLWEHFSYAELTENMRQKGDRELADLLNRIRLGDAGTGMEALEARVVAEGRDAGKVAALITRLEAEGRRPVCLLPTTERVNRVNAAALVAKALPHSFLHAVDQLSNRKPRSTRLTAKTAKAKGQPNTDPVEAILDYLRENTQRKTRDTGGMADVLALAPGARVMLIRNLDVAKGLYNGAMGTLKRIVPDPNAPDGVGHIVVDFDGIGVEVIERQLGSYYVGRAEVKRSQFPLTLAYAITIHKSQGLSLDCVVTELGSDIFDKGMAYVALSRVRTMGGLFLLAFDPDCVVCDPRAVAEYNRLRKAYTDLPEMKAVRTRFPMAKGKRTVSRPLADAGLAPPSSPPRKKAKKSLPPQKRQRPSSTEPRPKQPPAKKPRAAPSSSKAPKATKAPKDRPAQGGYKGAGFVPLRNEANWCFTNAAVQALLGCEDVREWAKRFDAQSSSIRRSLSALCRAEEGGFSVPQDTLAIRRVVDALHPEKAFLDGEQHDSSEFLECLLAGEAELRERFWVDVVEHRRCDVCGSQSERPSDGMLTVGLKRDGAGVVSWDALLGDFLVEKREVRCGTCVRQRGEDHLPERQRRNSTHTFTRKLVFPDANRFLLVRVPRFSRFGGTNPETRVSGFKAASLEITGQRLRVAAAVVHEGQTANRGHYVCLSRHGSDWLLKSDTRADVHKKFLNQLCLGKAASVAYLLLQRQL